MAKQFYQSRLIDFKISPLLYFNYRKTTDCAKGVKCKGEEVYEGKFI